MIIPREGVVNRGSTVYFKNCLEEESGGIVSPAAVP